MKKEKKLKFELEKFEVAKLSNLKKQLIIGGIGGPISDDPTTGTGANNGSRPPSGGLCA